MQQRLCGYVLPTKSPNRTFYAEPRNCRRLQGRNLDHVNALTINRHLPDEGPGRNQDCRFRRVFATVECRRAHSRTFFATVGFYATSDDGVVRRNAHGGSRRGSFTR